VKSYRLCLGVLLFLIPLAVRTQPPDELDLLIQTQMARRQIAGVSLAIIHEGRIADVRAYGTTTRDGKTKVTTSTLFQAGSVSKPVSALGALRLVDSGKLSLDEDVNMKLKSWRVPDNEFTRTQRVTLRRLLTHTAGLTVSGFAGYELTERIPSIPEVLDGRGNSPAVRVDVTPGTISRYSGGGFEVMRQLVQDVTGKPFATYMNDEVLKPLGMTNSTFQQPMPEASARRAAVGYFTDRSPVPGGWHVYPEMAAAGLWTTPTDLAKYVIGVQQAFSGKSKVLSAGMTRQMLTVQKDGMGLGLAVDGSGDTLRFSHNGRNKGFDTLMIAYAKGDGVIVMINGNDNTLFIQGNCCQNRIVNFIARKYKWPGYDFARSPEAVQAADVSPAVLHAVSGRYEFQNPTMMTLALHGGRIALDVDDLPDEGFAPASDGRFVSVERAVSFRISRNANGDVDGIDWIDSLKKTRRLPRIGPLFSEIEPRTVDPDPAFTRNVLTIVHTLAAGGKGTAESPLLTAGAQKEFSPVAIQSLQGVRAVSFMYESNVAGRRIERLGHPIQRVMHYRMETDSGRRWLLIHVDPNGRVADFDVVSN
jgi:CubicO group peptidase (beta-lactamase class C family)